MPPADYHNITGEFTPSVHSLIGTNSVSLDGFPYNHTNDLVTQAISQLPSEFTFNQDMNSGFHLGLGESFSLEFRPLLLNVVWLPGNVQSTIGNGARSSSSTSYLATAFIGRPNLSILLNAQVLQLGQTGNNTFRQIQFTQDLGGGDSFLSSFVFVVDIDPLV
jgi:hypothetical protein